MSVSFEQMVEVLRGAMSGGVTPDEGAYTHVYEFSPRRYGRKWMTKRAAIWKRRHRVPAQFTIEFEDHVSDR